MKKQYRIKSNIEFQTLISNKNFISNKEFVFYFNDAKLNHGRIGISVGKKLGIAVKRNLWKRQAREIINDVIDLDSFKYDGILLVRKDFTTQSFDKNKKSLENLLNKVYNYNRK
ncbi:MAG: ribonuclease P protein component [Anaerorhabdus sp.]